MRFLQVSEYNGRILYEEKETFVVRLNDGIVLPRDAIFQRIGTNISKYKHHLVVAEMIIKEQREEYHKLRKEMR